MFLLSPGQVVHKKKNSMSVSVYSDYCKPCQEILNSRNISPPRLFRAWFTVCQIIWATESIDYISFNKNFKSLSTHARYKIAELLSHLYKDIEKNS